MKFDIDKQYVVSLEDNGQDLLSFLVDGCGRILESRPFHTGLYKGGYIPLESQKIGELCMMHNPPYINFGFLKYNVTKITEDK